MRGKWTWALLVLAVAVVSITTSRSCGRVSDSSPNSGQTGTSRETDDAAPAPDPLRASRTISRRERESSPDDVAAPSGGSVRGRVVDAAGTALSGCRVRLSRGHPGTDDSAIEKRTDGDGTFVAEGLAPGAWLAVVAGGGHATRLDQDRAIATPVDITAGGTADVTLVATPLAVLVGTVTDADGNVVAGARIGVQCDAYLFTVGVWELKTESRADGSFERADVTPGQVRVFVESDGAPRFSAWMRGLAPGERRRFDVRLARAARFDLSVVDASDGSPIERALVWITDAESHDVLTEDGVRSDEAGRVSLVVPEGRALGLQVGADNHIELGSRRVTAEEVRAGPVTVRLERGRRIRGLVLYADGSPAKGVIVQAVRVPIAGTGGVSDSQDSADAEGHFELQEVPPGHCAVAVMGDGWRPIATEEVADDATDVEIRLDAGAQPLRRVVVRITGPGGAAIDAVCTRSGVHVSGHRISVAGGAAPRPPQSTVYFSVRPGAVTYFEAWNATDPAGRRLPFGHVFVEIPDGVPAEWTVEMPREEFVAGRVVDSSGRGVGGATITVTSSASGRALEVLTTAVTDAQGSFRIAGLGPATYQLDLSSDRHVRRTALVAGGTTDVVIALGTGISPVLTVTGPEGEPVRDAWITARPSAGDDDAESVSARDEGGGRYVLPGLPAGVPHDLRVGAVQFRGEDGYVRRDIPRWDPADTAVRLERERHVAGIVRRGDGTPFDGAVVEASGASGAALSVTAGSATGSFRVEHLSGDSTLRLRATAGAAVSETIDVAAGRHDVVLTVDVGAWFAVRLDDATMRLRNEFDLGIGSNTGVHVFPGPVRTRLATTPLVIGGLTPGTRYHVIVGPSSEGLWGEAGDVLPDGRTAVVSMKDGKPVSGRVRPADGGAVSGQVEALRDGVVFAVAPISPRDGAFGFPGLLPGRWTLRVVDAGGARGASVDVDVDAGRGDIELEPPAR